MCLDYRQVNKHLATDIYPLPRLEELVDQAAGHQYCITLDMREAYFQLMLDEESRDLTTFSDTIQIQETPLSTILFPCHLFQTYGITVSIIPAERVGKELS